MTFEWDDNKEQINIKKHGMDFETASRVFDDENRIEIYDDLHSDYEDRYITIGMIKYTYSTKFIIYKITFIYTTIFKFLYTKTILFSIFIFYS